MYHPRKIFTLSIVASLAAFTGTLSSAPFAHATESAPLTTTSKLNGRLNFISSDYPTPPSKSEVKHRPHDIVIYQYDKRPLGDRTPFLLVHGLRGEYWRMFRWDKVIKKFTSNQQFNERYKVYLARYDSLDTLDHLVPKFRETVGALYDAGQKRPITIMALSMGGNLVYEGMLDEKTDQMVNVAFTLGTPFRGSPLFCTDWMRYSIYKNLCFPWTRVDHTLDYKVYFGKNPNLLSDLRWDDADHAIPDVGPFSSRLPLGPRGDLTVANTINNRLIDVNSRPFNKKKIIAYGGYLPNPYMLANPTRYLETTMLLAYTFWTMKVPAHLAREHPVLKMLNKQISSAVPSRTAEQIAGTPFVYQLNDGITPISSALFLPSVACAKELPAREADLPKLREYLDVRTARVFRNTDHLTFIDGFHPRLASPLLRDELNPNEERKSIFDWMLSDVLSTNSDPKLAKENVAPPMVPAE